MDNNLGKILNGRRKEKGFTLRKLSNISGVHTSHLGRIERNERFPSAIILRKLAKPLGFAETELFKLAGFLSKDDSDEQMAKIKAEIKRNLIELCEKIDRL